MTTRRRFLSLLGMASVAAVVPVAVVAKMPEATKDLCERDFAALRTTPKGRVVASYGLPIEQAGDALLVMARNGRRPETTVSARHFLDTQRRRA